jgi:uncharacterized membrane protein
MQKWKTPLRWLLAAVMVAAGAFHFIKPDALAQIVPPFFPNPRLLVAFTGVCEIAGGVGLLIPRLSRAAAWGLLLLYIGVFPANVYQAVSHVQNTAVPVPEIVYWLRLPLQALPIALAYWFTRRDRT